MMPEVDGFEFRKMLLANDKLKDIPFVFLTSKSDEDDMLSAYDLSITDYIVKTSGPKIVTAKVSSILKSLGKERQKVVKELMAEPLAACQLLVRQDKEWACRRS